MSIYFSVLIECCSRANFASSLIYVFRYVELISTIFLNCLCRPGAASHERCECRWDCEISCGC